MTSFATASLQLLRRLVRGERRGDEPRGALTVLDGLSAVATVETRVAEVAALGCTYPAAVAGRTWSRQAAAHPLNAFGSRLGAVETDGPRSAMAAALGAALSGQRCTAFLSGPDLHAATDLLHHAAGQHVPLVVHLAARAATAHGSAIGSGHEAYHAVADTGAVLLFATNVQEAVDLALIGRSIAERALVPVVIAMDAEQTALAAQEVRLPEDAMIREQLGAPYEMIDAPTESQRLVFGAHRRRVPRFHDLDRPALLSPVFGAEAWGLGEAGRRPFVTDHVPAIVGEAVDRHAEATGRRVPAVLEHRLDDAKVVLVAQGSVVETAVAVADHARAHGGPRVGVLGVRCLRPLPASRIVDAARKAGAIAVLERTDTPMSGDGPLMRDVRAALAGHPEKKRHAPHLVGVPCGLGGMPLRSADLLALVKELEAPDRSPIYLGVELARATSDYPKRQAMMDALRRGHPGVERLGLRAAGPAPDVRPADGITLAVLRPAGSEHASLMGEAAAMIVELAGGHIRSRPGLTWQRHDELCMDVVIHCAEPLRDPGDDVAIDVALVLDGAAHADAALAGRLAEDGWVLVVSSDRPPDASGSHGLDEVLRSGERTLHWLTAADGPEAWLVESALGGLLGLFAQARDPKLIAVPRMVSARESALEHLPDDEREARLSAFRTGLEAPEIVNVERRPARAAAPEPAVPDAVRAAGHADTSARSITRFWNETGVLYRAGRTDELTADPSMNTGAVPAMSSTFRAVTGGDVLPVFDPSACDGDPVLWTSCPDGSIAPLAIAARALIDAGIEMVTERGGSADALRSVAAPLARAVNTVMASDEAPPGTAGAVLAEAFERVVNKTKPAADRRSSLEAALGAVIEEIGLLPVARTAVFFDEPERQAPGSGELFSLAVDPDMIKSPGLVLDRAAGHGLVAAPRTPECVDAARRVRHLWARLPDTAGATIERARTHPAIGPLGAVMLSRHALHAMAGGDGAEPASGAKLVLREALGLAEFHLQPRLQKVIGEIDGRRGRLAERIREVLSSALPGKDLDALAEGLDVLGRADVDLATLSGRVDTAMAHGHVDGARLGRLVDVARALADHRWRLVEGPDGVGRARMGVTITPGAVATWAGVFPYNAFSCPAVVGGADEAGPLARGLVEGHLRASLEGVRWMRRADLELDRPGEAEHAIGSIAAIDVADLAADERTLCPPMILVGDDRSLGGRGLAQLAWLLGSTLPVKIIVLGDIGGEADGGLAVDAMDGYPPGRRFDLALLALLTRTAYVAQTSPAVPGHFAESILGAMAFDGPALVHVHAPSPQRHGFAPRRLFAQAELAIAARAFPLLRFDPARPGVFGSRLDLDGNPDGGDLTPVHWAATERRFEEHFEPLADDAPAPTGIGEYVALDDAARAGRTPFVAVGEGDDERRLRVGPALVRDAGHRLRYWRTLQELAGVVTPFTEAVREEAAQTVATAHRAEIDELKRAHEAAMANLRAQFEEEATRRVAGGLMALAGYGDAPGPGQEGTP